MRHWKILPAYLLPDGGRSKALCGEHVQIPLRRYGSGSLSWIFVAHFAEACCSQRFSPNLPPPTIDVSAAMAVPLETIGRSLSQQLSSRLDELFKMHHAEYNQAASRQLEASRSSIASLSSSMTNELRIATASLQSSLSALVGAGAASHPEQSQSASLAPSPSVSATKARVRWAKRPRDESNEEVDEVFGLAPSSRASPATTPSRMTGKHDYGAPMESSCTQRTCRGRKLKPSRKQPRRKR